MIPKETIKISNPEFNIYVKDYVITNKQAVTLLNQNAEVSKIISQIDYNCMYVNTDNNLNVTIFIIEQKIDAIVKGKYCEDEIFFEESLIDDLKSGFDKSKINTYLKKVEMPMGLYYDLIKIYS